MKTINVKSKIRNYIVSIDNSFEYQVMSNFNPSDKYVIIYDKRIPKKNLEILLKYANEPLVIKIKGGESAKSEAMYKNIIRKLTKNKINKNDILVSVGGGTISDLCGYIASTYKRGMRFISFPTTTLAMVDASVGGKNGINVKGVKNAVGSIYPPEKVLIGLDILNSLKKREFYNGLLEALKTGLLINEWLYKLFLKNGWENCIEEIISLSLEEKIKIVEQDEQEKGIRRILNFGHTIGHAIETDKKLHLKHGEAIANGILVLSKNEDYFYDLRNILKRLNCPMIKKINYEEIEDKLKNDKKIVNGKVELIRVHHIGEPSVEPTSFDDLKKEIEQYVL